MSSTIYRFTPPTCTLEIIGSKSPLSRWVKQDVLKKFQFKLKFDDPRKPDDIVLIQGNQQDLSQLQTTVNNYLKQRLQNSWQKPSTEINLASPKDISNNQPYLKSQGLVHHELFFGGLTHNSNSNSIPLSTVQLFDLVNVLEASQSQIAVLPAEKSALHSRKLIPLWGGIAAAAIAAMGITTILLKSSLQQNIASVDEKSQLKSQVEIPELEEITPPSAPDKQERPQPKLSEPLASAKKLPPPPAVDTPKPKPNIPDPADYPLSDVARQSGFKNSVKETPNPNQPVESTIIVPAENPTKSKSASSTDKLEARLRSKDRINTADLESNILDDSSIKSEVNNTLQNSDLAANSSPAQSRQLQEVTTYFQEKWQPPATLKQSLEYRLVLNTDGTINKVVPLGKASRLYLNQTNIPVNQESFISPLAESESSTIRLLLNPDGRVQAFTE